MSVDVFLKKRNVSRETLGRLQSYEALIRKWTPAINLVARSTLDDLWSRHFLDSAQLFDLAPKGAHWADLGSGGGFPGLVVAILAADERPGLRVSLVESDRRKAAFLMTASKALGLTVEVLADRIEAIAPLQADVLSARALAPLPDLVRHARRHLAPTGTALFPKGATHAEELSQALETQRFSYETAGSVTDPAAIIYLIREIDRA